MEGGGGEKAGGGRGTGRKEGVREERERFVICRVDTSATTAPISSPAAISEPLKT